jgi:sulfane dehydrogenase subunit SoxC
MHPKTVGRRRFLKNGAALAGLAWAPAGAILAPSSASGEPRVNAAGSLDVEDLNALDAVLYGRRSRFVTTVRDIEGMSHPDMQPPRPNPYRPGARTPLRDSVGIITPASLHFTTQHFYGIPDINPTEQKLLVHGMVERELVFTLEELKRLPFVARIYFLECNGNRPNPNGKTVNDTHGRTACSEWTGVPLSVLLKEVGIKNEAKWIIAEGSDDGKHAKSVPLPKALDDVIVAYGQNGEPVRPDHGFPLRLIVPGFEGIYNVKWLRRIKVVDRPYLTFQEASRYLAEDPKTQPDSFEFGPKSVITYPSGQHQLPSHGSYVITGLAWSGGGVVRKVEVSTDGGKTYKEAEISGPALPRAHTRFCFPWRWEGEEAVLQSRCTDEKGQLQPTEAEAAKYWGYARQQLYTVSVTRIGHSNWIQPWRVNPDGKVNNGLPPVRAVTDMHG